MRGHHEGSITWEKDRQAYKARVTVPGTGGKRLQQRFSVRAYGSKSAARRAALAWITAARQEVDRSLREPPSRQTFAMLFEEWYAAHVPRWARSTREAYRQLARDYVLPHLGELALEEIRRSTIQRLYDDLLARHTLSPPRVRKVHTIIHSVLAHALRHDLVPVNPAVGLLLPRKQRPRRAPFTPEEVRAILEASRGTRLEAPIMLLATTGIRLGELEGLRWEDIAPDWSSITIQRQRRRGQETPPKTSAGRREIPLVPEVVAFLQAHKARQNARGWLACGYVVTSTVGTPFVRTTFYRDFAALLQQLGIRGKTPHSFRHTAVSVMLEAGVPIKTVQAVIGHSEVRTTLEVYGHLLPGAREQIVPVFRRLLVPDWSQEPEPRDSTVV